MSQAAQDLSAVVTRLDGRIEPDAAMLSTAASTEPPAAQIIELPVVADADELPTKIDVAVVDAPADLVETVEVTEIVDAVEKRVRSEEHTSELQSLMRISYAVFCLKKKKQINTIYKSH